MKARLLLIFILSCLSFHLLAENKPVESDHIIKSMHRLTINGLFDAFIKRINEEKFISASAEAYGYLYQTEYAVNYLVIIDHTKKDKNIWIIYPSNQELKFAYIENINNLANDIDKVVSLIDKYTHVDNQLFFDNTNKNKKSDIEIRLFHYKNSSMRLVNHMGSSDQLLPVIFESFVDKLKKSQ